MSLRTTTMRCFALVALVAASFALTATIALAGPAEPTLGVDALQAKIDANGGSIVGYLKTVIKGSEIVTIPVSVLSVTTGYDSGPVDMSSLILFRITDATTNENGGIAAGMSGSPIYVSNNATDTLIGALSYGDIFTTGGYGLATPIEAMANMQDAYAPSPAPRRLSNSVYVDGQVKDKVLVVQDPSTVSNAPADTMVAAPKSEIYIGGVNPKSSLYKKYAQRLATHGIDVASPLQSGLSSKTSTYDAAFEPGSAVAALAASGDMWMGGIGTVTYTDGSNVIAFGHPAFWDGASGLFLSNAWIDGIWPSTLEAYKLGRPAALRGTLTQDRLAGIVGVDGLMPNVTTVTAKATNLDTGKVATSSVDLPRFVANSSSMDYYGLASMGAYVAGSRVFDAYSSPGSAITTTTVRVSDGTNTYTLVRRNLCSDGYDIPSAVVWDVDEMVSAFEDANANGIAHADILSVNLESEFTHVRKEAEVVDVNVAGGLKTGANTAVVSFLQYGNPATQTVNVPFTIPSKTPLTGTLTASSVNMPGDSGSSDGSDGSDSGASSGSDSSIDRSTVKDVYSELNQEVDNTVISLTFQPEDMTVLSDNSDSSDGPSTPPVIYKAIETTRATSWSVSGTASKIAPALKAYLDEPGTLSYGSRTLIDADLLGFDDDGLVHITAPGISTTVTVSDGSLEYYTPKLTKTTVFVLTFVGDDTALPAKATLAVHVAAKVAMAASKTSVNAGKPIILTAYVLPKDAGGNVAFQRWNGYMWSTFKTLALPSSGTVSYSYTRKSKGSVKVRALFLGSATNSTKPSGSVTLKFN